MSPRDEERIPPMPQAGHHCGVYLVDAHGVRLFKDDAREALLVRRIPHKEVRTHLLHRHGQRLANLRVGCRFSRMKAKPSYHTSGLRDVHTDMKRSYTDDLTTMAFDGSERIRLSVSWGETCP